MDIQEATPAQIESFVKGAAAEYKRRGVPQDLADALLVRHLDKAGNDMNIAATATPAAKPAPARIEKVANELATALGVTRKK